jgi:hypothetical protein
VLNVDAEQLTQAEESAALAALSIQMDADIAAFAARDAELEQQRRAFLSAAIPIRRGYLLGPLPRDGRQVIAPTIRVGAGRRPDLLDLVERVMPDEGTSGYLFREWRFFDWTAPAFAVLDGETVRPAHCPIRLVFLRRRDRPILQAIADSGWLMLMLRPFSEATGQMQVPTLSLEVPTEDLRAWLDRPLPGEHGAW